MPLQDRYWEVLQSVPCSQMLTMANSIQFSFIHSLVHSFIHVFIRSFIHLFIHSSIQSFLHRLICHSFIHLNTAFIHLQTHSCIQSLSHLLNYLTKCLFKTSPQKAQQMRMAFKHCQQSKHTCSHTYILTRINPIAYMTTCSSEYDPVSIFLKWP